MTLNVRLFILLFTFFIFTIICGIYDEAAFNINSWAAMTDIIVFITVVIIYNVTINNHRVLINLKNCEVFEFFELIFTAIIGQIMLMFIWTLIFSGYNIKYLIFLTIGINFILTYNLFLTYNEE